LSTLFVFLKKHHYFCRKIGQKANYMAKDKFHNDVRRALEKEGWTITHDPFFIRIGRRRGFIDLGAEQIVIGAERGKEKIAVEIKTFGGASDLDDFEDAIGQFIVYLTALEDIEPDRYLFLAVPERFYNRFFDDPFFLKLIKKRQISLVVYNEISQIIVQWIK
jgi:XisH protein